MKKIIISGGTGYIGRKVFSHLIQLGAEPLILARPSTDPDSLLNFPPNSIIHWGKDELPTSHALLLLGTLFKGQTDPGDAERMCDANIRWPLLLADSYLQSGGRNIIGIGTCWERVGADAAPANSYAASKAACRVMLKTLMTEFGGTLCWLRLTDTFSVDDPRKKIYEILRKSIRENAPLQLTPGEQIFDPLPVNDAALAIALACLENPAVVAGDWGISGGEPETLRQKIEAYLELVGSNNRPQWGAKPYRKGEPFIVQWTPGPSWWRAEKTYTQAINDMERSPGGMLSDTTKEIL